MRARICEINTPANFLCFYDVSRCSHNFAYNKLKNAAAHIPKQVNSSTMRLLMFKKYNTYNATRALAAAAYTFHICLAHNTRLCSQQQQQPNYHKARTATPHPFKYVRK